jgi:hypothetical protein
MHNVTKRLGSWAIVSLIVSLAIVGFSAAQASVITYNVTLDGPSESPPNVSPGVGTAVVEVDATAHTMRVHVISFSGLVGYTTASHIHAATAVPGTGTAGVATTTPSFAGFPLGVFSGTFDNTLDMTLASSYNPSYVTAHGGNTTQAETDLFLAIAQGRAYLNIHSSVYGGGEIRGFLTPAPVPAATSTWGKVKSLYR